MALDRRGPRQVSSWVEASQLEVRGRHPFYRRLNEILDRIGFDSYVERLCRQSYAEKMGRPAPGVYSRCFLVGYFQGIARSGASPAGVRTRGTCWSLWG